jgi:hypothetical protein
MVCVLSWGCWTLSVRYIILVFTRGLQSVYCLPFECVLLKLKSLEDNVE